MNPFIEPKSLADYEARRAALVQDVIKIQQQLTEKKVVGRVGDQAWREYNDWRKKATAALSIKQREMAFIKAWAKKQHAAKPSLPDVPVDVLGLLTAAEASLTRIYTEVGWDTVEPDEQRLLDAIRVAIGKRSAP